MKTCNKCGLELPISSFGVYMKRGKPRVFGRCKVCERQRRKEYAQTKQGLVARIYNNQKKTSKERGHIAPLYTKDELKDWLFSKKEFHSLFCSWEKDNYNRWSVPSCDRLNDYLPYSLDNIQIVSWKDNHRKSTTQCAQGEGKTGKQCKKVAQYTFKRKWDSINRVYIYEKEELVGEYYSTVNAEKETLINSAEISDVANGRRKSAHNFMWEYVS